MIKFNKLKENVISNKYIKYLDEIGINTEPIIKSIRINVEENSYKFENFYNNIVERLSANIFLENIIFEEVNKYLNIHYKDIVLFEDYIKIDTKSIIATQNSIIQRPKMKKPSEIDEGFEEDFIEDDNYVKIAKFESEMIKGDVYKRNKGQVLIFEGIIPLKVAIDPFSQDESSNFIWENTFHDHEPRNIIGFCKAFNSIESESILWLNSYFINMFELKLDNHNNGLRALNKDNEIILEYRQWRDDLIDNGASFVGQDSNIANLEGCDLILRKDYFDILKYQIPNLVYRIHKLELIK